MVNPNNHFGKWWTFNPDSKQMRKGGRKRERERERERESEREREGERERKKERKKEERRKAERKKENNNKKSLCLFCRCELLVNKPAMMENLEPLTPLSPPSQSSTVKVKTTLPATESSRMLREGGGSTNIGGQSLKSRTWMLTLTSPK